MGHKLFGLSHSMQMELRETTLVFRGAFAWCNYTFESTNIHKYKALLAIDFDLLQFQ